MPLAIVFFGALTLRLLLISYVTKNFFDLPLNQSTKDIHQNVKKDWGEGISLPNFSLAIEGRGGSWVILLLVIAILRLQSSRLKSDLGSSHFTHELCLTDIQIRSEYLLDQKSKIQGRTN